MQENDECPSDCRKDNAGGEVEGVQREMRMEMRMGMEMEMGMGMEMEMGMRMEMRMEMRMRMRMRMRMDSDKDGARRQVGPEGCGHGRKRKTPERTSKRSRFRGSVFRGRYMKVSSSFSAAGAAG